MNKVISNDKAGQRTETEPVFTQSRDPFEGTVTKCSNCGRDIENDVWHSCFDAEQAEKDAQDASAVQAIEDRMVATGVDYSGTVVTERYHSEVSDRWLTLGEVAAEGGKISRLRMLRERGLHDISYIHATLPSGEIVHVVEDMSQGHLIPARKINSVLIEWAKEYRVFAKGLGLLDRSNWSILG